MKRRPSIALIPLVLLALMGTSSLAQAQHSLGGGIHYLRNLGDIQESGVDLNQNSFSLMGSYQFNARVVKLEADVEYIFDYVGTGEPMWEPSAWALLGGLIYGGAGIGIGNTDGEWQQNPFYALRAGVAVPLSSLNLDFFATYRFQSDNDLENLTGEDLDSLTFAALVRFALGGS